VLVTGWNNGAFHKTGAGYGIRISREDRDRYFNEEWDYVIIQLDDEGVRVHFSSYFWGECSELRSAKIGRWMIRRGHQRWSKGSPPVFELVPIGERKFRLQEVR
jgi:hypothetical protein